MAQTNAAIVFPRPEELSADQLDREWLQRTELRSLEDVVAHLGTTSFSQLPAAWAALFVDNQYGLIRVEFISNVSDRNPIEVERQILRQASNAHAHGLFLASFDQPSNSDLSSNTREIMSQLARKANAIGIDILNHFVLTRTGWIAFDQLRERWGESDRLSCPAADVGGRAISDPLRMSSLPAKRPGDVCFYNAPKKLRGRG